MINNIPTIICFGGAKMIRTFTPEEMEYLSKNENVETVSEKQIIYKNSFKEFFVREYMGGKGPTLIFESAGLYKRILGAKRIERATKRWITAYKNGTLGVSATLKQKPLTTKVTNLSPKEFIKRQEAKIRLLEMEVELLKKVDTRERGLVCSKSLNSSEIFELIRIAIAESGIKNAVSYLCKSAGVSRSGYYNYCANEDKRAEREMLDLEIRDIIINAMNFRGYKKGSRSIKMLLEKRFGICYNRKRIVRIMRKYNIICPVKRKKYRYKISPEHRICQNHVKRNFKCGIPGKILLTDISYLQYNRDKTAYLATVLDAGTNEVLSFSVSPNMKMDFILETADALLDYNFVDFKNGVIHSDQGWHYTNPQFRVKVAEMGLLQSMSRRGNCWDNAPQESFFSRLKDEVDIASCGTYENLIESISDFIDYYNNDRYQWSLNRMSPVEYRNYLLAA